MGLSVGQSVTAWASHNFCISLTPAHLVGRSTRELHRTDLDPLHICYSCVTWSFYGTPNSGIRGYLWLLLDFRTFFFPTRLPSPAVIEGEESILTETWYSIDGWYQWEVWPFLRRDRGDMDVGGGDGGEHWNERREGKV